MVFSPVVANELFVSSSAVYFDAQLNGVTQIKARTIAAAPEPFSVTVEVENLPQAVVITTIASFNPLGRGIYFETATGQRVPTGVVSKR